MSTEKKQTAVGKFLSKVGIPILKGAVKSVPFVGNVAVDIIENVTKKDIATGEPKKHDPFILIIEAIGAVTLAYLVINGTIPVEKLIEFIKAIV